MVYGIIELIIRHGDSSCSVVLSVVFIGGNGADRRRHRHPLLWSPRRCAVFTMPIVALIKATMETRQIPTARQRSQGRAPDLRLGVSFILQNVALQVAGRATVRLRRSSRCNGRSVGWASISLLSSSFRWR